MSQIQFLQIVIFAAIAAIAFGLLTTNKILSLPKGTKRMTLISSAIQEGAKAYLNRQYTTIAIVGIVIFFAFFLIILESINPLIFSKLELKLSFNESNFFLLKGLFFMFCFINSSNSKSVD